MAKFIKKPVAIEAFQMTKERREINVEWPEWLHKAWQDETLIPKKFPHSDGHDLLKIKTLEGYMDVSWGDYIIQGVKGELYPCKPDIFKKTYYTEEEYAAL